MDKKQIKLTKLVREEVENQIKEQRLRKSIRYQILKEIAETNIKNNILKAFNLSKAEEEDDMIVFPFDDKKGKIIYTPGTKVVGGIIPKKYKETFEKLINDYSLEYGKTMYY